ncbi:hypothetical protein M8818_000960 [Zalaria obscura]|uniref:Uncharacterized protein n=1 Tax=Zalaria obscura TaxID=2024903 RepID=A0ACC3SLN9_9PEZI
MRPQLMRSAICAFSLAVLSSVALVNAHGDHSQTPIAEDADWATRHMAEEHHINAFDAGSFFNLHDYDSSGTWTPDDIRKTYGLLDESTRDVPAERKQEVVDRVLELFDVDRSGSISYAEFTVGEARGLRLPDFGLGPGHHGDDEYEYEIHHFEKYHDENTREEDLTHPEDIAHFKKHEEMEEAQERQELLDRQPIVEANIPAKFRRHG